MLAFKAILFSAIFVSAVFAAPPSGGDDECRPSEEDMKTEEKCCKMPSIISESEENAAFDQCLALAKEQTEGDKKGPPVPTGYECLDDCVFTKLGFMGTDKKMDSTQLTAHIKKVFTGSWAPIGASNVVKCLELAKTSPDQCSSGSDVFSKCMIRESYLNCPSDLWTTSDGCKKSKDRLLKCPKLVPITEMCHHHKNT